MEETQPRHRHNNTTTTELPPEVLLFHILPRLPAKTVVRFRRVSKQWHSFLKTPRFYDLHNQHVTKNHHQNDHGLFVLSRTTPRNFLSVQCKAPNGRMMSLAGPFNGDRDNMSILTSCNGMLCIGTKGESYDDEYNSLILLNPFTTEYKVLSKTNSHKECYKADNDGFRMYYSSSEDDYRLLRITKSCNVYIYSLKSDSWRKIESMVNSKDWNFECWMPSVLLNEKVYFLNQLFWKKVWIITFDTKTEKFTKIANRSFPKQLPECWRFFVESGCIHLHVRNKSDGSIELLRLKGDGKWTKEETYSTKECFSHYLIPLQLISNGNRLMRLGGCDLFNIDLDRYINGDDSHPLNPFETFVSPNRYI